MRYKKKHNTGFTLIEVIAVLIILVIISAVAISRGGSNESNLRSEVNDLKAALRYAQQMAIASDDTVTFGITVTSGTSGGYTLVKNAGVGTQPFLPGESSSTHTFSGGVTASGQVFTFNQWGGLVAGSATTLSQSGGGSKIINVISETGYAYESES
jgi:prepilin-type N-terminal cleavage/methylation domain-containing protein